jgi:tRNA(Arg) A34 adenosine deaminase TadA
VLRLDGALDGKRAGRRGKSKAVSSHRSPRNQDPESHAKTRCRERFGINKGVLECSGLTELGMGIERVDGKSKAVSSHRSPRKKDPESHAETRSRERFGINKGVLECSGLTELGMGIERVDGKSKAVSSHRSPRNKDPESHAETRRCERVGVESRSCPRRFVAKRVSWSAPA